MIGSRRVLAVVIGRAGSKGLPGKNVMPLAGRPMIAHTIEDALQAETVDRVIVSTDGQAIADAARQAGVEAFMRPAHLASDSATVDSAVRHAIGTTDGDESIIVILYANVPIRPDDLIDRAVRELSETGADSVQSYSDVGKHHPYWMVTLDDKHRVQPHVKNTAYRRQDLPRLFIPDGGVIAVTRSSLFKVAGEPHAFLGEDRRGIIVPPGSVVDIDGPADLAVAQAIMAGQQTAKC
jgi:N-acylneuraminate cytidylyltransferase